MRIRCFLLKISLSLSLSLSPLVNFDECVSDVYSMGNETRLTDKIRLKLLEAEKKILLRFKEERERERETREDFCCCCEFQKT